MLESRTKPKDERIVAQINRVYKNAYYILNIGVAADLSLKLFGPEAIPAGFAGFCHFWFEFLLFLAANFVALGLLWRRGLMDDNALYAECDTFPLRHYLLESAAAGVGGSLLFGALRLLFAPDTFRLPLVAAVTCGSLFVCIACACLAAEYLMFRVARRRRRALYGEEDER